jgi:uncharacterized membrane protein
MSDIPLAGGRRRRWLLGGLIASLALNAFVIGAVATDLLRIPGLTGRGDSPPLNFELRWLRGRLPDEGMARVEAAVAAARPEAERRFERLKELRRSLAVLAAAPTPDRTAIDARLADIRTEVDGMLTEIQRSSVDALLALPPEMRAQLADDKDRD